MKKGFQYAVTQLCLCVFCIMFPLQLIKNQIMEQYLISQVLVTLIFGIAGIGIYAILGNMLSNAYDDINKLKKKEQGK